ncbi:hypothetical protein SUDANB58_02615 [Streptomyces sp. enrichment culture]|uniref:DUF397 domain-containing protein n=1 Tax=Streptomyces sp. enrichment culture TaxID=1795815 RepID=UPI003F5672A1
MRNSPEYDPATATWPKSSYSQGGSDCPEATRDFATAIPVRDSKNPHGPKLVFRAAARAAFVTNLKDGAA